MNINQNKNSLNNAEIVGIGTIIENRYELKNEEVEFFIQFHNSNMTIKEILSCIDLINSIYERCCNIFEVSTQDFELKPIKLESRSWFEKVIGNGKVFSYIGDLLNRAIGFIYRNYTNEGKIKNEINKIDLLKDGIRLTEICEDHEIDTTIAKETLEGNLNAICQDIYKLTSKSNIITINENTYDKNKKMSQQLIDDIHRLSIEAK